jgi:RNA polymerase sigma factor (sigma-70 family)
MATDSELIRDYARTGSESAFTELVRRHINLVFSAALRESHGDVPGAQGITQAVFAEAARKAARLGRHPALAGWLYTCVRQMSANARRADHRRQHREQEAHAMKELLSPDASEAVWRQIEPVLDDAMHQLGEIDRAAVVLRYFEGRSHKEVGLALGVSESAARKRVDRSLEKLRATLATRGITSTVAGLTAALALGAVVSAPSNLAATVAVGALAAPASTASTTITLLKLITMTKLQAIITGAIVVGMAIPLVVQHQTQARLRAENESLNQQMAQLQAANESQTVSAAPAKPVLTDEQLGELLRLRSEVGMLRRQTIDLEKLRLENSRLRSAPANATPGPALDADEQQLAAVIGRVNDAKQSCLGLFLFAGDNGGQFPTNLNQLAPYLKNGLTGTNDFQLLYQGTMGAFTNPGSTASTIVIRERTATPAANGGWLKVYGFADGHVETHVEQNGDFDAWEAQHMPPPVSTQQPPQ